MKRKSLSIIAYEKLKKAVIQGEFKPGTWLQESTLTEIYGVSRTPLREAFNQLKSEGFIEVVPRKGAFIVELSREELDSLFEAREVIETAFLDRSIRVLSAEKIKDISHQFHKAVEELINSCSDREQWEINRLQYLKLDRRFHDLLIHASGNRYWESLYLNIRDRIDLYGNRVSANLLWLEIAISDHEKIIDSILAGDAKQAKDFMVEHIKHVRQGIDSQKTPSKLTSESVTFKQEKREET